MRLWHGVYMECILVFHSFVNCFAVADKEDEIKQARKSSKLPKNKSCDDDPERLARTIFVGNLPLSITRKVIK